MNNNQPILQHDLLWINLANKCLNTAKTFVSRPVRNVKAKVMYPPDAAKLPEFPILDTNSEALFQPAEQHELQSVHQDRISDLLIYLLFYIL